MIYTVTVNPSLDYVMSVPSFSAGVINRSESEELYLGGKGINVSVMLKNLGFDSCPIGFAAGFSGAEILRLLSEFGLRHSFEMIDGTSRINVKLRSLGNESDINAGGPTIPPNAAKLVLSRLNGIRSGDWLVLAGSVPKSVSDELYRDIMSSLPDGVKTVVDAGGRLMRNALAQRPFLIKPNFDELSELAGRQLSSADDVIAAAEELRRAGARNVLVSLAEDGAVLLCENGKILRRTAPCGRLVNSVAAGDSMVAGFIAGLISSDGSPENALRTAVAAGSATAFCKWIASADEVQRLLNAME